MSRDCYKSVLRRSGNVYILCNNKNTEENIYHAAVRATKPPIRFLYKYTAAFISKQRFSFSPPTPPERNRLTAGWCSRTREQDNRDSNRWSHTDSTAKSAGHSCLGGNAAQAQAGITETRPLARTPLPTGDCQCCVNCATRFFPKGRSQRLLVLQAMDYTWQTRTSSSRTPRPCATDDTNKTSPHFAEAVEKKITSNAANYSNPSKSRTATQPNPPVRTHNRECSRAEPGAGATPATVPQMCNQCSPSTKKADW